MPAEIHREALTFPLEPVCVHECMYMHIFLILREDFCSTVAQRAGLLPEQPTAPAALLCVPHDSQTACPRTLKPVRVVLLRFVIPLIIFLRLALTSVKTRV